MTIIPPAPDSTQRPALPTTTHKSAYHLTRGAAGFLLGCIVTACVQIYVSHTLSPTPQLDVELTPSIPEPQAGRYRMQLLTVRVLGERSADDALIAINYPRPKDNDPNSPTANIRVESRRPVGVLQQTSRTTSVTFSTLAPGDVVTVALVTSSTDITPNDVAITYKDGSFNPKRIRWYQQ